MNFKVAGGIIRELSEKIPSNLVALNEIIKNSYDAGAPSVQIILDTKKRILTITDNGFGMNKDDIEKLLHIGKSEKKYGTFNNLTKRYTQGSKGLGILAVFKFGSNVKWTTVKSQKCFEFSLDYNFLNSLDEVQEYEVEVKEKKCDDLSTGTTIEITLDKDEDINILKGYFDKKNIRDKILNSFINSDFEISLDIDGAQYHTNKIKLLSYCPNKQIFSIQYSSDNQLVSFIDKDAQTHSFNYEFDKTHNVKIELDIIAFSFPGGKKKNNFDSELFYRPTDEALTPLVYVNNNLFNNYSLFDPDIMRSIKGGQALAQLIGYVKIFSDDKNMEFNSDRTNFQENELTVYITNFLIDINKFIQKKGSGLKKNSKGKENTTTPTDDGNNSTMPPADETTPNNSGNESDNNYTDNTTPPSANNDTQNHGERPNSQNSESNTAVGSNDAEDSSDNSTPITIAQPTEYLIPSISNYTCSFSNPSIGKLVSQINYLSSLKNKDYKEVLACSMRAVFELCIDELGSTGKTSFQNSGLEKKVEDLINHLKSNTGKILQTISIGLSYSYLTLQNELDGYDYGRVMSLCHLGVHKSTTSLTKDNIDTIGKALSRFLPIASVILNDANINNIIV